MFRLLVAGLVLSWIAGWRTGMLVFRQKLTPEYHPLPGLIKRHVTVGLVWAALLGLTGLASMFGGSGSGSMPGFSPALTLALGFFAATVVYTGYGLRIGKPTGVWVHVFLALFASGLGLILLLGAVKQYLYP